MQQEIDLQYQLETIVDKHSLQYVLNALANICHEKAEHLRSNWQDEVANKLWDKAGNKIAKVLSSETSI